MYFPENFDLKRARELSTLVVNAYKQYETFKNQTNWNIPGDYKLIQELYYKGSLTNRVLNNDFAYKKEIMDLFGLSKESSLGEPFGFIAKQKNNAYIIFRGTMTTNEWMKNLDLDLKPYPEKEYGKVHEGFLVIFESLKESIKLGLDSFSKLDKIYISGHSLGGAISTLLVPYLKKNFRFKNLFIYTFGSPRVGNDDFVRKYNDQFSDNTFRISNTSDMVVSVPFPVKFMGIFGGKFTHVDTPVYFTCQKGELEQNHSMNLYADVLKYETQPFSLRKFFRIFFNR